MGDASRNMKSGPGLGQIVYSPIGIIRTPFKELGGMPIQSAAAKGIGGRVEILPGFRAGLKDIEGFSHLILIYHFHKSSGYSLEVKPFLDEHSHGLFSTRAPKRPNPLGVSVVRLVRVDGCTLHVEDVDILDRTPLLDIKSYVPEFDVQKVEKTGWLAWRADKSPRRGPTTGLDSQDRSQRP